MYTMNRCLRFSNQLLTSLILTTLVSLVTTPLAAQVIQRQFPTAALRGTLQVTNPPDILINNKSARLSPGARIRGTSNTLVMSASLVGQNLPINYVRDGQGLVHEVWLLTETEAREKRKSE
jgi:hypothetical protein